MNQVTPESKTAAIKTLAIIGFIVMIVIAVWLAVSIVRLIPTAFTRLADLAEDIYGDGDTITLKEETIVANAGETITIAFNGAPSDGSYTFTYACADGVSVALVREGGSKEFIACDEAAAIADDEPVVLAIASEKNRFVDLSYTITFTPASGDAVQTTKGKLTVVNASIPVGGVAVNEEPEEEEEATATPTPTTPTTPSKPIAGTPVTTIKYVSQMPVSDPNGFSDLAVTVLGTGELNGKTFVAKSKVDANETAAIVVEVKNIGTKTSEEWGIEIELPNGEEHRVTDEKGLKPNERAVMTFSFDAEGLDGKESFSGKVTVKKDTKTGNNDFDGSMTFED